MNLRTLVASLALVGCAGPASQSANGTTPDSGGVALLVRNHSEEPICFVHAWPSHLTDGGRLRGPDRLGPAEIIGPGEGRAWDLDAGDYDLTLLGCDEVVLMQRRRVHVDGEGLVLTFREREPEAR